MVAFNTRTGVLVGGFSLSEDGTFTISGLEAGPHVLRVEPLDDGDITSFFNASVNVDLNFNVRFHDRIVVVPPAAARAMSKSRSPPSERAAHVAAGSAPCRLDRAPARDTSAATRPASAHSNWRAEAHLRRIRHGPPDCVTHAQHVG